VTTCSKDYSTRDSLYTVLTTDRKDSPRVLTKYTKRSRQANYAYQNDTAKNHDAPCAYLTIDRDGSYTACDMATAYPYTTGDRTIQRHMRTGKAEKVRKAAKVEMA
jgi:hypothetical protein